MQMMLNHDWIIQEKNCSLGCVSILLFQIENFIEHG